MTYIALIVLALAAFLFSGCESIREYHSTPLTEEEIDEGLRNAEPGSPMWFFYNSKK